MPTVCFGTAPTKRIKMKKLKKRFVNSTFLSTLIKIEENKRTYLHTILIDFIFLALFLSIGRYIGSLIPSDPQQLLSIFKNSANLLVFAIAYPIIYYIFIIFLYSTTKLAILRLISKKQVSMKKIGSFFLLNLYIYLTFIIVGLLGMSVLGLIFKREFLKYILLALLIPFIFFLYSILNIAHTKFIKQETKLFRKSFKTTFKKIKTYGTFILWNISIALAYLLVYNIIHIILRYTLFANKNILTLYGGIYVQTFNIISLIFLYFIISFNRIYFLELAKNVLPQHKSHPTKAGPA